MNRKSITFIIVMFLLLLSSSDIHAILKTNLALKATASASYTTDGYDAACVNDNNTTTIWENYRGEQYYNTWNYVELDWEYSHQIINSKIVWYVNGNVQLPTEAYLAYWDGHQWVKAKDITVARTSSQTDTIYSNKVRLYMKGAAATGLTEFYVYGYETTSCTAATLTALYSKDGGGNVSSTNVELNDNEVVTLCPLLTLPDGEEETPVWNWSGPDVTAITPTITLTKSSRSGLYTATYMRQCGKETSVKYAVSVNGSVDPEIGYLWSSYSPKLDYNFRQEFPALKAPTKLLPENVNMKGYKADGWWAIRWGAKKRSEVTDTAMVLLLKKMNTDFAYFRDVMGWPPDKRAKKGYYSTVDVFASGLYTDTQSDTTALGGWQSATTYNDESWADVLLSYYPIYSFDPKCPYSDKISQQNACVHEGIHAILADLPGCKQSAWFQEGGNTWLQGQAAAQQTGSYSDLGFLDGAAMVAPFMPIECYSGWLQDDSFGGPSAEGVNMFNSSKEQICTWRNLLGGVQYANNWPFFLGEIMGNGSIPWIWRYCPGRVLEGMADSLGEMQMRHLIMEYRSKQATLDLGKWSNAFKVVLAGAFGTNIISEAVADKMPTWKNPVAWTASPYAIMTALSGDSTGWYKPEYRTTPGWSGANQIPIHVSGNKGDSVSIDFLPKGKNMVCQLCYRTKGGQVYYSRPVSYGTCSMILPDMPANNVIFAVVTNTDYIYYGEETRKTHFDYRLRMGSNAWKPASSSYRWYDWTLTLKDATFNYTDVKATNTDNLFNISLVTNEIKPGEDVMLNVRGNDSKMFPVMLFGSAGNLIYRQNFAESGIFHFPGRLTAGVHLLQAIYGDQQQTIKLMVK